MLIDSHCHLHLIDCKELNCQLKDIIALAKTHAVSHMLCVGTTLEEIPLMQDIVNTYQEVSMSIGLHPNETIDKEPTVEELFKWANLPKVVAIGETGLDYYRSTGNLKWQQTRFRTHIEAALSAKKPLIIHTRLAAGDTIAILKEEKAERVAGVIHCFTEDWEMAKKAMDLNFLISFSGIVTFKNAVELQAVAKKIPLDRLLIETDSPFLAPVPFRGKINQPAYVKYVAEFLAELKNVSVEELAYQTTMNYHRVFSTPIE